MPESHEPEKYSIDDMMDRLKRRPQEDGPEMGELVTRADGTQAIRIRKRKRRTLQPHKEEMAKTRRARMLQVSGALLLLIAIGMAAGGAMIFGNSPVFRKRLLAGATIKTGAAVEMSEFRINPKTANANVITMNWPEGHVLRHLLVRSLNAEIYPASFLGKALAGDEISAGQAVLELDVPDPEKPRSIDKPDESLMDIRFKRYASSRVNMRIGPKAAALLNLYDSEFSIQDLGNNTKPQLLINRGNLAIPHAPAWRISRAHIEFRGENLDVVGLRLQHESDIRGELKFTGIIHPYDADRVSTLAVTMDAFPFAGLVGERLGKIFSGRVDTAEVARSNYFSFTPAAEPKAALAVTFQSALATPFQVTGFPAFKTLARLLDDKWFENPVFESDVTGTVRRADDSVAIGELRCTNLSRIAIHADLRITNHRQLSGTMRLGIAEAMLKAARNSRLERVFSESANGFRWANLTITGRDDAPLDNLSALYDAVPAQAVDEFNGKTPGFDELTRPD